MPLPSTLRRCCALTYHSLSLAHLFAGHFFPYDAARSVAGRTFTPFSSPSLTIRSPRVAHIVSSFRTQYIYPSPALAKARQLWPVFLLLSRRSPTNSLRPQRTLARSSGDNNPRTLLPVHSQRVLISGYAAWVSFPLSNSRTLARTFHLRYTNSI